MSEKATRKKKGSEGTFRDEAATKENQKELARLRDGSREHSRLHCDSSKSLRVENTGEFFKNSDA